MSVEFNDIIVPKCAGQLGRCYITDITITRSNMDYIYKDENATNLITYSNIYIVTKQIKEYIIKEKCDIKELKKKIKKKGIIGLNLG